MGRLDNVVSQMEEKYQGDETFFGGNAFLPKWVGYLIVVGFGAFFSVFTVIIMWAPGVPGGRRRGAGPDSGGSRREGSGPAPRVS